MPYDARFAIGPDSDQVPEISVISANKNHGRYLEECIISVLAQSGVTYEHILIDGGSTDETNDIVAQYPHIIFKVLPELNAEEAYEEAARISRGKYIMVTTSTDGYLGTNWFRTAWETLETNSDISLVWGNCQDMSEDGLMGKIVWPQYLASPPPQKKDVFFKFINSSDPFYFPELNYCVRKKVFMDCFFSTETDFPISELKDMLPFNRLLFKFHFRGYLGFYINAIGNFGRRHRGQRTDVFTADGRLGKCLEMHADAVVRYRALLWSGQAHAFRDGNGDIIDTFNWPTLAFDIGAYKGAKAARFAAQGTRVICFEPNPNCAQELREKFSENPLVRVEPSALGATAGTQSLSISSQSMSISTFSESWKQGRFKNQIWDKHADVLVRTLDSAIEEFGLPDYCAIDASGFEPEIIKGLSRQISVISFSFEKNDSVATFDVITKLLGLGYVHFNIAYGDSDTFRHATWIGAGDLVLELNNHPAPLLWGTIFASAGSALSPRVAALLPASPASEAALRTDSDTSQILIWQGLAIRDAPVRLHLGCGERRLPGYINIDYPPDHHNVMQARPDFAADITTLSFPPSSVDEIRLHHVFEHFNRVVALGLLINWHRWLKPGGKLIIETPDFEEEVRAFLTPGVSFPDRMSAVRSLEGDQTAAWGYHVGQWFGERFYHTLTQLGYTDISISRSISGHRPPLHNLTVIATRDADRERSAQISAASGLLANSTVAEAERATWTVWVQQLEKFLENGSIPHRRSSHEPLE